MTQVDDAAEDRLVTGAEVARTLGVQRSRVDQWRARGTADFPAPVASVWKHWGTGGRPRSPLWLLAEVEEWWKAYDVNRNRGGKPGNKGNRDAVPPKRKRRMAKTATVSKHQSAKTDLRVRMERARLR